MKTIVITGATGAIGQAAARALAEKGNVELVLAGRSPSGLEQLKKELTKGTVKVEVIELDLGDSRSVKKAADNIKSRYQQLHGLVNVAAVYKGSKTTTAQGRETMMATNHLGPFQFSLALMPLLKATPGSKVLTVSAPTTTKINFEDINSETKFSALGVFGASKMMNLLFTFRLGENFKGTPHASMAFHPGLVKSDLLKESPAFVRGLFRLISSKPEKTGKAIAQLVLEGDPAKQNGKFFNNSMKEMKAAKYAYDNHVQEKLWKVSETLILQS